MIDDVLRVCNSEEYSRFQTFDDAVTCNNHDHNFFALCYNLRLSVSPKSRTGPAEFEDNRWADAFNQGHYA